jgi:ACR3 family arsenite efflux pump ArsB
MESPNGCQTRAQFATCETHFVYCVRPTSHLSDGSLGLFAKLHDGLWLYRLVPCAAFGIAEAEQFLQRLAVGRVPEERAFPAHVHQVFILQLVWSHLTKGDAAYTLVQVSVNDLIMLLLFVPIVQFLVHGASSLTVPFNVLLTSVIVFIVVPLLAGVLLRSFLLGRHGLAWLEEVLLPKFAPVTIAALLATLVLIFAFQADNITGRFFHVVLIAVPITAQVYFNAGLAYGLMKWLKVEHSVAAPGALIGASNFFELAVATAIALFGPESGAALATVVGALVEVPVMLSVCAACNRTHHWFPAA